jgi:flagellar motor protein MotB
VIRSSKPPDTDNAPAWIISFTDMTCLEMAFFIALMSFSTPRKEKLDELQGSFYNAFGHLGKETVLESELPPRPIIQGRDHKNPNAPTQIPRFRPLVDHPLRDELQQLKDQSGPLLEIDRIAEGYRLRIGDAVDFAPRDPEMTSASFARLEAVAAALRDLPFRVVVVGYASRDEEQVLGLARSQDLALRRAVNVTTHLADDAGLPAGRLAVAGYGSEPDDRRAGRVELILADALSFQRGGP